MEPRRWRNAIVLIAIVLLALILRLFGIGWGLPFLFHPDEYQVVNVYLSMVKNLDLNPHWFTYPSLMMYVNALLYGIYFLVRYLFGSFHRIDIAFPDIIVLGAGRIADSNVFVLGRAASIVFGLGTVILVYFCTRKLTNRHLAGSIAATFTAVSSVNVVQSRLILPNIYVAFFVMAALWFSLWIFEEGKRRHYILAGLAVGFAAASKYNGVAVLIIPLTAHFLRYGFELKKMPNLILGQLSIVFGFLLAVPFAFLDYQTFFQMMSKTREDYSMGWPGQEGDVIIWYLRYLITHEGLVPFAALGTVFYGIVQKDKRILVAASFPVAYYLFIHTFSIRNDKTILPMLPVIHLLGAIFIIKLIDIFKTWGTHNSLVKWSFSVFLLVSLSIPFTRSVSATLEVYTIDSRTTSRIWIEKNIPAGSVIALENYSPYLDRQQFKLIPIYPFKPYPFSWFRDHKVEYIIFSEGMFGRYFKNPVLYRDIILKYEDLLAQLEQVIVFDDGGYEIRIYRLPPYA